VDTPNDRAADRPPTPGGRLRAKLPEILIEAASIVAAVLLAFAVDEWRDARAKRELAERARWSVLAELRANHEEFLGAHAANARQLESLQHTLDRWAADPKAEHTSVELAFSGAQLSDVAWETTRTTQAIQLLPFEWVLEIARVYDVQALYKTAQLDMLQRTRTAVAEFGSTRPPPEIVAPLRSQLQTFQSLGDQLRIAYERVLADPAARRH
jgi:hypothetical protein